MLDVKILQEQIAQVLSSEEDTAFLANFFKKTNFSKPETVLTVLAIKAKDDNFSWVSKDATRERVVALLAKIAESQNSSKHFDLEKLNAVPIDEVLELFNVEFNGKDFLCPNDHKGSKVKLVMYKDVNVCKCHNCDEVKGDPVTIATWLCKGDFIEACKILAQHIGEDNAVINTPRTAPVKVVRETKYRNFDKVRGFTHIEVEDFMETYSSLKEYQKMKLVYSYIYRYSISTKREKLINYYQGRGIKSSYVNKIGFLSQENIIHLVDVLKKKFPIEDLIKFNVINDTKHEYFPLHWNQLKNCLLVPSFDIYTDLVEGFMLRPVDKTSNKWFKGKEKALSTPSILEPMPFGVGYKVLSSDCDVYITEGHIDALSLPEDRCFIATPGVNSFKEDQLGLLKGRNIKLVFDQDESNAGMEAAYGFSRVSFLEQTIKVLNTQESELEGMLKIFKSQGIKYFCKKEEGFKSKLLKARVASVEVVTWDKNLGNDLNELLVNGNLTKAGI